MHGLRLFLQIPGISPLTFADEQLFRAAISTQSLGYSHSWLYLLRAAHVDAGEMGFKYVSPELIAVVGYRHGHVYVTPLFDTTEGVKLEELCDALYKNTACPVLVKKLQQRIHTYLPFSVPLGDGPLPLEDDSCPESVVHLQRLFISPAGEVNPAAKKLNRRARAFEKLGLSFRIVEDLGEIPLERLEYFLAQDSEKYANYLPIIQYLHRQPVDKYKYRIMVFMHRGRVRGLYMTEVLSLTELGMYGGITSKDVGGITEWMDLYFFRAMFRDGIRIIHLGGAENPGIAEYITKLLPQRPTYFAQTLLYEPAARPKRLEVTIRPVRETDFNELAVLYRDLYNSLDDLGETWTKESAHSFISHFYHRQPDLFFVAEYQRKLVGAIVAAVQPWWDGNHLVEGELFSDSRYGGTDLNRQLLKAMLSYARTTYRAVAWDTFTPTNAKHPLGTYEQIGFTEIPEWVAISGDIHTVLERLNV